MFGVTSTMDQETFRTYILDAVRSVFTQATMAGQELAPVAFVVTKEGVGLLPVGRFMVSDTAKDALMQVLSALASDDHTIGIAIVNEIWTAVATKEEVDSDSLVRPSQRADKGEAAMVRLEFRGGGVEVWTAVISHDERNTRTLAEFKSHPIDGGRMAEPLFPQTTLPN